MKWRLRFSPGKGVGCQSFVGFFAGASEPSSVVTIAIATIQNSRISTEAEPYHTGRRPGYSPTAVKRSLKSLVVLKASSEWVAGLKRCRGRYHIQGPFCRGSQGDASRVEVWSVCFVAGQESRGVWRSRTLPCIRSPLRETNTEGCAADARCLEQARDHGGKDYWPNPDR